MHRIRQPCVYILASKRNGTLYIGVTSDLIQRVHQHRIGAVPGFTHDHGVNRLMWFEQHGTMDEAILREKRLKKWNRAWEIALIEELNPHWDDLAIGMGFERLPD
ncbi:GIY-YIG nuclease family protein [Sphingobium sp. BYY-5]|uniref:GIY-YIG nuclease family protein n=1 Tax=Sphingobium sp. BYY-5 TaxID=2926400 RepID=UPI001FA70D9D|nr:GIY-YIG nuclease family protein [Sphingobium sp. BYY-5]MCI4588815.1 GIY-YIG nuclease family protein [Sphingobium sp. BYY-5]